MKDAWQVQREDYHQRGAGTGRLVADEAKTEPKIIFRIQIFHMLQSSKERRLIKRLVYHVKNHPNKDALIANLQKNRTYRPFRDESKKMIHNMGNV